MRVFGDLGALVNRIFAWADRVQRRHGVLGFPYAVIKKYGDDDGGREAALMTYYGFLSIFPLLLLGVAVLSRVLADNPELRQRLITATIPAALRSTVENSLTALPTLTVPFVIGLIGLLFSGTGVVFSASQTLNNVAAVPRRLRGSFWSRYIRVFGMLAALLLGAVAVGALTVVVTALPGVPEAERAAAVLGSAVVIFAVLLFGARLLLARPAPVRALWPAAVLGAAAVTLALNLGAPLLARLVTKAGPVYGSFATVAGMFALLYLVNQALVYAAEVAAVRYAGLWPRALDVNRPTAADVRVMTLLAREQERIQAARVGFRLVSPRFVHRRERLAGTVTRLARAGSSLTSIGSHRRRRGLGQEDDPDTHHGEGDRRHGQYPGARLETLVEQPHAQGDTDDRVDDHQERLGDPQRPDVQRHLLQDGACGAPHGQGVHRPAGEHPGHAELGEGVRRGLDDRRLEGPDGRGRCGVQGRAPARGSPVRRGGQDSSAGAAGHRGHDPVLARGVGWPPSGSPATMNTARPRQVRAAATQVIGRMDW